MTDPGGKQREFDRYAQNYSDLIGDPVRQRFATSSRFFAERKLQVISGFCGRAGTDTRQLDWLDVGCGQGELLRLGLPHFRTASGCDPSSGMLAFCADLTVRHQPSLDVLPFDDNCFDFITLVCVYHHVDYPRRPRLTQEAVRLLRPQGLLCVIEHNPWNPVTRLIVSRAPVDADAHLLSVRQTRRLLVAAGMTIRAQRFFLLFPERMYNHFAIIESALGFMPVGGQYAVFGQK